MSDEETEYCPNCNYDLTGLPVVGDCPECGTQYSSWSESEGSRSVPVPTEKQPWLARHARSILLVIAAVPVLACSGVLSFIVKNDYVMGVGLLLCFLMVLAAVIAYFYEDAG